VTHLELSGACHSYGAHQVLHGVDLQADQGDFVSVLGASGSGKTTLLRIIAGFERLESGVLTLGGQVVDDGRRALRPERRKIGYVPQEGALFPHLRVASNVAFGLGRRAPRGRVRELLALVGLTGLERRFPHELSGGQQQRVALARALAVDPELVLLDEPFSALDAALRASLRQEVAEILRSRGTTTVLVTHDQDEALSMADRVAVLREGRIVADARPEEVYRSPVDADMAEFVGEANLMSGKVVGGTVDTSLGRLVLQDGLSAALQSGGPEATVLVRPEQLEVRARSDAPASGGIPGRVVDRAFFGHDAVLHVLTDRGDPKDGGKRPLLVRVTGPTAAKAGAEVLLTVRGPVMAWPAVRGKDASAIGGVASQSPAAGTATGSGTSPDAPGSHLVGRS
jgi:iron(III) transport system ATP-binding protein